MPSPKEVTGTSPKATETPDIIQRTPIKNANQLMPSRRRRGMVKQEVKIDLIDPTSPEKPLFRGDENSPLKPKNEKKGGGLAGLLAGLDKSTLEQLKRKNAPEEEFQEDPRKSIIGLIYDMINISYVDLL